MIFGAHFIVFSTDVSADRAFFRDVLGWASIDAGDEWLIFRPPPGEATVHPGDQNDGHQFYLMCEDLRGEIATLEGKGARCSSVEQARWGSVTKITLPGAGEIGLYDPKHPTALDLPSP